MSKPKKSMQLNWRKLCPLRNAKRQVETHYPPRGASHFRSSASIILQRKRTHQRPSKILSLSYLVRVLFWSGDWKARVGRTKKTELLTPNAVASFLWRQLSVKNLVYKKEKNTSQITEIRQSTSQTSAAIVLCEPATERTVTLPLYHWHSRRDNYNSTPQSFRRMGGGGKKILSIIAGSMRTYYRKMTGEKQQLWWLMRQVSFMHGDADAPSNANALDKYIWRLVASDQQKGVPRPRRTWD
jgi:hypothetical protein